MYRPSAINELRTAVKLLVPAYKKYNGVAKKMYPSDGEIIFVNWKTYGGNRVDRERCRVHCGYGANHNVVSTGYCGELSAAP